MSNTTEMRNAWAANLCGKLPAARFTFWNGTTININKNAAQAFQALDNVFRKYKFAPPQADTGAFVCRAITGGTGYSLHAYGIAVDCDWTNNPYQTPAQYAHGLKTNMDPRMIAEVKGIMTLDGVQVWGWGGDYSGNKDTMHFELHVTPTQLARGVRNTITPIVPPIGPGNPDPTDPKKEKIQMIAAFVVNRDEHAEYLAVDPTTTMVVDVWQGPDGELHQSPMSTTMVDGKPVPIKGIEHLESHYDEATGTNIFRAVGFMLSPWILFREEPTPGAYKWHNWVAYSEWTKFVHSQQPHPS